MYRTNHLRHSQAPAGLENLTWRQSGHATVEGAFLLQRRAGAGLAVDAALQHAVRYFARIRTGQCRIGGPEQGHHGRAERRGEVHRAGIHGDQRGGMLKRRAQGWQGTAEQ